MKKKNIIILLIIIIPIASYFIFKQYTVKSTGYNLNKMLNGTDTEKYLAIENLASNNVKIAIPYIVKELDNYELVLYKGKTPEEVNCFATYALRDLTGLDYGNSCCCKSDGDKPKEQVLDDWRKWYDEDYSNWILN